MEPWNADYHETLVHQALVANGYELWLTPRVVVWQTRGRLSLGVALRERFVWGQSFAATRVSGFPALTRFSYAAFCVVLPLLLAYRLWRGVLVRRRTIAKFLAAAPLVILLTMVWAVGELTGYLRGRSR